MIEIILLTSCITFLMLSFFFSGSETGFLSINRERFYGDLKSGDVGAKRIQSFVENLPLILMTALLGNNLANIALVASSRRLWLEWIGDRWIGLYLFLSTTLFLLVGEIFPKITFMKYSNLLLYRTSLVMRFFYYTFYLLTYLLSKLANPFIDRVFKGFGDTVSRSDFKEIVNDVHEHGELNEQERMFMENFSFLTQTRIAEIMTPLIDLFIIHKKSMVKDILGQAVVDMDVIPVYGKRVDDIIGFVDVDEVYYAKKAIGSKRLITDFVKEPVYIPESVTLDRFFNHLLDYKNRLIVVIDEHGGCSGVVTWKNILDNLFGFKYDLGENSKKFNFRKISENVYEIDSAIDIDNFNNIYKQDIQKDGFETLGGFINHLHGEIPQEGTILLYRNIRFTVLKSSRTSVDMLEMEILEKNSHE